MEDKKRVLHAEMAALPGDYRAVLEATFIREPKLADVPYPVSMEPNLVIEFYSR